VSKGFLTAGFDLYRCEMLAHSLRLSQAEPIGLSIMVPEGMEVPERYHEIFEHIVRHPELSSDAEYCLKRHAYDCTPYDQTLLISPSMLFSVDVSYWWDHLARYPLLLCSRSFSYQGRPLTNEPHRAGLVDNRLPNIYTALTYFQKDENTEAVFSMAGVLVDHWKTYRTTKLQGAIGLTPSDDAAFACALALTGYYEAVAGPDLDWFSFVAMGLPTHVTDADHLDHDWANRLGYYLKADGSLIVSQFLQTRPFLYQEPSWITPDMISVLTGVTS